MVALDAPSLALGFSTPDSSTSSRRRAMSRWCTQPRLRRLVSAVRNTASRSTTLRDSYFSGTASGSSRPRHDQPVGGSPSARNTRREDARRAHAGQGRANCMTRPAVRPGDRRQDRRHNADVVGSPPRRTDAAALATARVVKGTRTRPTTVSARQLRRPQGAALHRNFPTSTSWCAARGEIAFPRLLDRAPRRRRRRLAPSLACADATRRPVVAHPMDCAPLPPGALVTPTTRYSNGTRVPPRVAG